MIPDKSWPKNKNLNFFKIINFNFDLKTIFPKIWGFCKLPNSEVIFFTNINSSLVFFINKQILFVLFEFFYLFLNFLKIFTQKNFTHLKNIRNLYFSLIICILLVESL